MASGYALKLKLGSVSGQTDISINYDLVLPLHELSNVPNQMLMETGGAEVMENTPIPRQVPTGVQIYLVSMLPQQTLF